MAQVSILADDIRRILQDRGVEAYRYETADILRALDLAIYDLYRLRPDVFWRNPVTTPSVLGADIDVDPQFERFLALFAAGTILTTNSDYMLSRGAAALIESARMLVSRNFVVPRG